MMIRLGLYFRRLKNPVLGSSEPHPYNECHDITDGNVFLYGIFLIDMAISKQYKDYAMRWQSSNPSQGLIFELSGVIKHFWLGYILTDPGIPSHQLIN